MFNQLYSGYCLKVVLAFHYLLGRPKAGLVVFSGNLIGPPTGQGARLPPTRRGGGV